MRAVRISGPVPVRFWAKVDRRGSEDCWPWTAGTVDGYGRMIGTRVNGKATMIFAHRWAYEQIVGPIPEGLHIDHLCRNRACVNPAHMEPVPKGVNTMRGESPAARYARADHCPNGHPYEGNVFYRRGRRCRTCDRAKRRRYLDRKKRGLI